MKKMITFISLIAIIAAGPAFSQQALTLERSIQLALQNNTAIETSRLQVDAAARIKTSAQSNYFPDISAGAILFDATKEMFKIRTPGGDLPVYDGNPASLLNPTQFAYFPGGTTSMLGEGKIGYIDVIQPVYAGGRIVNGNRLAELEQAVAQDKSKLVCDDIILATEQQYWQIVSLDEKHKTIGKYEELLNRLLTQVEDAHKSGLVMRNDVLKVKLKHSEVLLNKSKLESGRKLAAMAFSQHIGIPYDSTVIYNSELPAVENPQNIYLAPHNALHGRTEYALLEKAVKAEQLQSNMKLGKMLPSAAVGARAMVTQFDAGQRRTIGLVFGTISIPISDWIGGAAELEERSLQEKMAENNFKNNSELLILQMEKAWQDLNNAHHQVRLCEESKRQAEENLKVNDDSYGNGLTSVSDLLEAQALLQQAQDRLVDACADLYMKKSNYLRVTGRVIR